MELNVPANRPPGGLVLCLERQAANINVGGFETASRAIK